MDSMRMEIMNKGRGIHDWEYVPLSEPRVVMQLIRGRSK